MKINYIPLLLALVSPIANADPVSELLSAFQNQRQEQQDMRHTLGYSQTAIRGYLGTKGGMTSVSSATSYLGYFATKAQANAAILGLGYTLLASLGMQDIYRAPPTAGSPTGFILLVYNDTAGNASEIYLINDTLP